MNESLSEGYLRWLESQIRDGQRDQTYWDLIKIMFEKRFDALVPHDDNRMQDGLDLRTEFCHSNHISMDALHFLGVCSFLEVLIGLSHRLEFNAGGNHRQWAWQLLDNLELTKMIDPLPKRKATQINHILDAVIRRTYKPDGQGGFFPLAWPDEDQTKVELWYQMAAYIHEIHPEH
jgi:hypothetical protein